MNLGKLISEKIKIMFKQDKPIKKRKPSMGERIAQVRIDKAMMRKHGKKVLG